MIRTAPRSTLRLGTLLEIGVCLTLLLATIGLLELSLPRTVEMLGEFSGVVNSGLSCLGRPGWVC
jgi:hypothetical protein